MARMSSLGSRLKSGNRKAGLDLLIEELGKELETARKNGRPTAPLFAQLRLALRDRAALDVGVGQPAAEPETKAGSDGVDEVAKARAKRRGAAGYRTGTDAADPTRRGR